MSEWQTPRYGLQRFTRGIWRIDCHAQLHNDKEYCHWEVSILVDGNYRRVANGLALSEEKAQQDAEAQLIKICKSGLPKP